MAEDLKEDCSRFSKEDREKIPRNIGMIFLAIQLVEHLIDIGLLYAFRETRQQIYSDRFGFEAWDHSHSSRCFVHLCNSLVWQSITGHLPPYAPPAAKSYSKAGLPWFNYYRDDVEALPGGNTLAELKSVSQISKTKVRFAREIPGYPRR